MPAGLSGLCLSVLVGRLSLSPARSGVSGVSGIVRRMSAWAFEKNALLGMNVEERRRSYKVKSYLQLIDVSPWSTQGKSCATPLKDDVDLFSSSGFKIDSNLNSQLVDKISIWNGDITQFEIDAIVNAANRTLLGGGGVDGAIHRAAGPVLLEECKDLNGCPTGEARITGGYFLPAKFIIHTVGPTNRSHDLLKNCYTSCFTLMRTNNLKSIAFPCVGTGVYGFPQRPAAHIACAAARLYLEEDAKNHGGLAERIIFCTFDPADYEIYKSAAQLYFPLN